MEWLASLALGYLLGSVPFGLLLTRLTGAGDLRSIGSGNIGATNVLRTGRKGLAAATLLLDAAKGFVAVVIVWQIYGFDGHLHHHPSWALLEPVPVSALGAILGHCFPIWLKFRGGKGVATNAGICFGLAWQIGLTYAVVWFAILALTRVSSLAGMSAVVASAIAAFAFGYAAFAPVLVLIAVIVIWQHRGNIGRLRAGTEPRVGGGRDSS